VERTHDRGGVCHRGPFRSCSVRNGLRGVGGDLNPLLYKPNKHSGLIWWPGITGGLERIEGEISSFPAQSSPILT
jgi:hypothetical protein